MKLRSWRPSRYHSLAILCITLTVLFVLTGCGGDQKAEIEALKTSNAELQKELSRLKAELETANKALAERVYNDAVREASTKKTAKEKTAVWQAFVAANPSSPFLAQAKEQIASLEPAVRLEESEAAKCPLEIVRAWVTRNSIGTPEARIIVKNVTNKTIDAFKVDIDCFNNFGDPVEHYLHKTNTFRGISQLTIRPGATSGENRYWTLYGHENTTKIQPTIREVHFTDGSTWVRP